MTTKLPLYPKTNVKFDPETFEVAKRNVRNMAVAKRGRSQDPKFAEPVPREFSLKLTNSCSLRCNHCFQWGSNGFHNLMQKEGQETEMAFSIVEKVFASTRSIKSNAFLWGGEPMFYSRWDDIMELLRADPRSTIVSTNGMHIEARVESLLKASESLALVVSLDGFQDENDALRGRGTFARALRGIDLLLRLQKQGAYRGRVTVSCVINNSIIGKLFEFLRFFEDRGVDSVYFVFPWYIPEEVAQQMDIHFAEHFAWLAGTKQGTPNSWHSYSYRIEPERINALIADLTRMTERSWNVRVRLQPGLKLHEVGEYVLGLTNRPAEDKTDCFGISNRMEVLPSGDVTPCKQFPEFVVGNLKNSDVIQVWQGERFERFRTTQSGHGLMPTCARCITLYLNGV